MASVQIPRFFLYGEAPREVHERFLHLEALDDRSRPANWNIRPHTHANLHHVFHIVAGGGHMSADGASFAFCAPCLLLVPAGVVHGFAWTAETCGSVLTVSGAYFGELAQRSDELLGIFARPSVAPGLTGTTLSDAFDRLSREVAWSAPGHRLAVEALLSTILVEGLRHVRYAADWEPRAAGPHAALVARFRELLEAQYRSERAVEAYATALGISSKRLRAACLAITGAPPLRLIRSRLLLEAKRLIIYSHMTIAETAYYLGFEDPAYFTRFFTRACGASPRSFRRAPEAAC